MAAVSETWPWYILLPWFESLLAIGVCAFQGFELEGDVILLTFNQGGHQGGDKLFAQGGIMVAFKERIGDY